MIPNTIMVDLDADPMVYDGWEVVEHTKGGMVEHTPTSIDLHMDSAQGAGCILGTDLRAWLKHRSPFNANYLDFLMQHPHLIPEWWKRKAVSFWGTIYRRPDGDLIVRSLIWDRVGSRWAEGHGHVNSFDGGFNSHDLAAVPRLPLNSPKCDPMVDLDADPSVPYDSEVVEHTKGGMLDVLSTSMTLHLHPAQQTGTILGTDLRAWLKEKPPYNVNYRDFLLHHPQFIPHDWKRKAVYFWGTIFRGVDGTLSVPGLLVYNGVSPLSMGRNLVGKFNFNNPAAVPASPPNS